MAFWNQIARLVTDPPPNHLFEVSEAGIAFAHGKETSFEAFEPGTVVVSPVEDNLLRADAVSAAIGRVVASRNPRNSATSSKKRKPAAVILPDYAARVSVLDFDSFPSSLEEQNSLVRFRVKKTIPFDIDSAAVSHHVQPHPASKKVDVIAVTVALEVIARYEALFRSSGIPAGRGDHFRAGGAESLSRRRRGGARESFGTRADGVGDLEQYRQIVPLRGARRSQ